MKGLLQFVCRPRYNAFSVGAISLSAIAITHGDFWWGVFALVAGSLFALVAEELWG